MFAAHIQIKHEVEYGSSYHIDSEELYGFLTDLQIPVWTGDSYADEYSNEWEIPRFALKSIKPQSYRRIKDSDTRNNIRNFIKDALQTQTGDTVYISFF